MQYRALSGIMLLVQCVLPTCESTARGEAPLIDLIENIRRNETLYDDVEVIMTTSYDIGDREPSYEGEVTHKQWRTRFVSQGQWFRVEREGTSKTPSRTASRDRIRAFDGETTRTLEQKAIGNISRQRQDDETFIQPHILLLRRSHVNVPLSVYLSGHAAISAHPRGRLADKVTIDISPRGEDDFNGLKCQKVLATTLVDGKPAVGEEYWLAEDRTYLVVQSIGFDYSVSRDIPQSLGRCDELKEIAPGIWFPSMAELVTFDRHVMKREGRQIVRWREQYVVELANLGPKYDHSFFSNVEFPNGAAVYELERGEITRSWRQGAPEAPGGPTADVGPAEGRGFAWRLFVWGNAIAFLSLAVLFVIQRARAGHAAATK